MKTSFKKAMKCFWKSVPGILIRDICLEGVCPGFMSGVFCPGVFCPDTSADIGPMPLIGLLIQRHDCCQTICNTRAKGWKPLATCYILQCKCAICNIS